MSAEEPGSLQEGNRQMDLGSLTLYDSNAIHSADTHEATVETLTQHMVENVKFIFSHVLDAKKKEIELLESLPEEKQIHNFDQTKLYLSLPEPSAQFPRSRRLPEDKPPTKWENFAKEKGIRKKKKSGMNFNPELKMQVAKWGRKSAKNAVDIPIREEKVSGRNPFTDQKYKKNFGKAKRKFKQLRNLNRT